MRVEQAGARLRAKGFQRPLIRSFIMAENVEVTVIGLNTEVQRLRPIPLVVDRLDETYRLPQPELDRPFVGFMTRVTFHPNFHTTCYHSPYVKRYLPRSLGARTKTRLPPKYCGYRTQYNRQ